MEIVFILCVVVVILVVIKLSHLVDLADKRRWYARGVPRELTVTYEIRPDGLFAASELGQATIYWSAINEVALQAGYWLFLMAGTAAYVPHRFFASTEAERAFIGAAFELLSPEAQRRGGKTKEFLLSKA